jgi:hypothetical protein
MYSSSKRFVCNNCEVDDDNKIYSKLTNFLANIDTTFKFALFDITDGAFGLLTIARTVEMPTVEGVIVSVSSDEP